MFVTMKPHATAAEFADKYIKGQRDFPQKTPVAVELVTKDNVARYGDYGRRETAPAK